VGRSIGRLPYGPYRSEFASIPPHERQKFSAASLAHSSAFLFPGAFLWGWTPSDLNMAMSGLALRSIAMCFLAWIA